MMDIGAVSLCYMGEGFSKKSGKKSIKKSEEFSRDKLDSVLEIINSNNNLDLILFPGFTLEDKNLLKTILDRNTNKKSIVFLEAGIGDEARWYSIQKDKKLNFEGIKQLFALSSQANSNMLSGFLKKLEKERRLLIKDKVVRLVICGENNMLRNQQSMDNKVSFRIKEFENQFNKIYQNTDIFLNPAHTPMGNLGKMKKRWSYLSDDGRLSIYTTNIDDYSKLDSKRIQYVFYNGSEQEINPIIKNRYRLTIFNMND